MKPQARLSSATSGLTLYLNEELGNTLRKDNRRWAPELIYVGDDQWEFKLLSTPHRLAVADYVQGRKSGWPYRMSIGSNNVEVIGAMQRPLFGNLNLTIKAGDDDWLVFSLPPESEWEAPRAYVRSGGRSSARVPSERELSPEVAAVRRMGELIRELNELRPQIEGLKLQVMGRLRLGEAVGDVAKQYELASEDFLRGTIVRTEVLE